LAEWKALGVRTDVAQRSRYRGRAVTIVGAGPDDVNVPAIWLDPDYGVVRIVTREKLNATDATVDLTFSEHRRLRDNVYFPYRQEFFMAERGAAAGRLLFLITVKSVQVNRGVADALFDPDELRRLR